MSTEIESSNSQPIESSIILDRRVGAVEGLTRQLYTQLRAAIVSGRLRAGEQLPPTRELAQRLGVARLTVATAYEWLSAEGYVYGRIGAGTFVASAFAEAMPQREHPIAYAPDRADTVVGQYAAYEERSRPRLDVSRPPLTAWARRIASIPLQGAGTVVEAPYDMRPGISAADAFPWARWRRVVGWADPLDHISAQRTQAEERAARGRRWDALLGPIETRMAVADWLRRSRAVHCAPEQVLIAGSVQQILALLARLLVEPGQSLLVEDPSYIGFHAAFLAEGAQLRGIPVDESGLRVAELPDPAIEPEDIRARLLVVTPSHQYPTGVTLTLERRVALLDWARRAAVTLVEDDYDGDLRLEGQPLEALRGLDDRDEVIYLGTFSKALYPVLRLGYAVLPQWLIEPVARARAASDRRPTWRDALAVARFIEAGELERHLARVRRLYRGRRDALVASLIAQLGNLGELARIGPAEAGIHLLVGLPDVVDDQALAAEALRVGVAITALSPHYGGGPQRRSGALLGFGALNEERLDEAVRLLAPLVRTAVEGSLAATR